MRHTLRRRPGGERKEIGGQSTNGTAPTAIRGTLPATVSHHTHNSHRLTGVVEGRVTNAVVKDTLLEIAERLNTSKICIKS